MTIIYQGQAYQISEEAYEALCACGPDIAAARTAQEAAELSDEVTRNILRAEGFTV